VPRSNTSNRYVIPTLPNTDPRVTRVIQDLADRVNYLTDEIGRVRAVANDVTELAKKERPVQGVLNLPGQAGAGDGFIRISKDGVIISYASPIRNAYTLPLDLSSGETSITVNTETILRQTSIPANFLKRGDHLRVQAGGFILSDTGVVTSVTWRGRFGSTGLASPEWMNPVTFAPGVALVPWYMEYVLTHDADNPDFMGIGGQFNFNNGAIFPRVDRGEIVADFTVDNTLYLTAQIAGTGANQFVVSETYEVLKHSLG
jgi:hypothetical protein